MRTAVLGLALSLSLEGCLSSSAKVDSTLCAVCYKGYQQLSNALNATSESARLENNIMLSRSHHAPL